MPNISFPPQLDRQTREHLQRMHEALFNTYNIADATRWITDYTFLNGDRFSFKDHEYQEKIVNDTSRLVNVQKPAQIGMSELMCRLILALCKIIPNFSVILTFPFSGDAEDFMKTRISRVIQDSPLLSEAIDPNLDNVAIKGIATSLLYARGTSGSTQALSIPCDLLVHDEVDKSDPAIIGQYQSRIRHSKWKLVRKFSTPTLAKRGISAEMDVSKRYRNLCQCYHCNHYFVPSFFDHVKVQGLDDLRLLDRDNIRLYDWMGAKLLCPRCGKEPSLEVKHRQWVIENPGDNFEAYGYYCSPFDVPKMTSVPDLVNESVRYEKYSEFMNQGLGLVASNDNDQILEADVLDSRMPGLETSDIHCFGADMGLTCHIVVGRLRDGVLYAVHKERCRMEEFEGRKIALQIKYRVVISVCDSQPYTDMILRMQRTDKNLFGAVFTNSRNLATYTVKMVDKDDPKGKLPINQVLVNRETALDELMGHFKQKLSKTGIVEEPRRIMWQGSQNDDEDRIFIGHILDMKREQKYTKEQELAYVWTKSKDARDHYHHALLYLLTACKLIGAVSRNTAFTGVPVAKKFLVTHKKEEERPRTFFAQR